MAILTKSAYHSFRGEMSSTPLSNGLGESGQNPLGRNAAGCNGCSNKQTLHKQGKRLGSDIKPLFQQHVMPPLGMLYQNFGSTTCQLAAKYPYMQLCQMKRYTARCEFHSRCPTSRCLARHCLQIEKHRFNEGMCTWYRIIHKAYAGHAQWREMLFHYFMFPIVQHDDNHVALPLSRNVTC